MTSGLRFDTASLIARKDEATRQLWLNGFNDVIELRAFALPPDIPVRLGDAPGLRAFYDAAARTQAAQVLTLEVVDLEVPAFDGSTKKRLRAVRLMMRAPAKPRGWTFVGSIALPFKRGSFVLRHQATETLTREDLAADADVAHPEHALTRIRYAVEHVAFTASSTLLREPAFESAPWYAFWQRS